MAIVLGNLCIKFSAKLGFHVLSSRVKRASVISCCRGYGSSGPVRYIPKKYREVDGKPFSPPTKSSEELDKCSDSNSSSKKYQLGGRGVPRISGLDEEYQDQPSVADRVCHSDSVNSIQSRGDTIQSLELNDDTNNELEVTDDDLMGELEMVEDETGTSFVKKLYEEDTVKASKTKQDAEKLVIEALGRRAYTAVELRKKLHGKRFPHNIIEEVITDCQCRGLINDYLYAESFSRSRWSSSFWGPRRIKQALHQKGVDGADAEKAMKLTFEHGDSGGDQELRFGMSDSSLERLFVQASKQWQRGGDVPHETRKSRIVRWLQYRGFNWSVTNYIVKKLEAQHPP
ncbi:regulatory protein RecX [Macadamia integrifolia]|uniref:regulatory protein RecX n=1 Tax=Macadamia integrifolia TaxID=60698 RepID=UPI001C52B2AE|nr:regulatory protein RecX [Macadamia integrifolia]